MPYPKPEMNGPSRADGFTLIELIAVLLIIGIVSVTIAGQIGNATVDLDARTDTIKAHLRAAQSRAMDSDLIWGIRYNGTGYFLFHFDGTVETPVRLPAEEDLIVDLSGSHISLGSFAAVSFDAWGRPYGNATGTGASGLVEIQVSSGSIPPNRITITAETGFIP